MHNLLDTVADELVRHLEMALPSVSVDWWSRCVLDRLSVPQMRIVEEKRHTTLRQLDLAALLRVLDQNWYELVRQSGLDRDGRTWAKELQALRNRWAHRSTEPVSAQDRYRDADTIFRFLEMLGSPEGVMAEAEAERNDALRCLTADDAVAPRQSHSESGDPVGQSGGKASIRATPEAEAEPAPEPSDRPGVVGSSAGPTYLLTLHKTYFNQGFFNLGVDVERFVSREEGQITLLVGPRRRPLAGRLSRTANSNGTPRVFGGATLRDWFQGNFNELDRVTVSVLGPKELLLQAAD